MIPLHTAIPAFVRSSDGAHHDTVCREFGDDQPVHNTIHDLYQSDAIGISASGFLYPKGGAK